MDLIVRVRKVALFYGSIKGKRDIELSWLRRQKPFGWPVLWSSVWLTWIAFMVLSIFDLRGLVLLVAGIRQRRLQEVYDALLNAEHEAVKKEYEKHIADIEKKNEDIRRKL